MRIHTSVGFLFKLKRKTPGIPRSGYGFKKTQGSAQNLCKNHTQNTFFQTLETPDFILLRKRKLGASRAPLLQRVANGKERHNPSPAQGLKSSAHFFERTMYFEHP